MCGIVSVLEKSANGVANKIMQGLCRLEYRGYDSAGIALFSSFTSNGENNENDEINCEKNKKYSFFHQEVKNYNSIVGDKSLIIDYFFSQMDEKNQFKEIKKEDENNKSFCRIYKKIGKTSELKNLYHLHPPATDNIICAMGHTRWATHGEPTIENAHPIISGAVCAVHNGIIHDYEVLRSNISRKRTLVGETDTEVMVAMIDENLQEILAQEKSLMEDLVGTEDSVFNITCPYNGRNIQALYLAVNNFAKNNSGAYSAVFAFIFDPRYLIALCNGLSLIVAITKKSENSISLREEGSYVVSDIVALPNGDYQLYYMEKGEIALVIQDEIAFFSVGGEKIVKNHVNFTQIQEELGEKNKDKTHFSREIKQQPEIIRNIAKKHFSEKFLHKKEINFKKNIEKFSANFNKNKSNISDIADGEYYHKYGDINGDIDINEDIGNAVNNTQYATDNINKLSINKVSIETLKNLDFSQFSAVSFIACGTSYHAACCACHWFNGATVPYPIDARSYIASEFTYSWHRPGPLRTLYVFISQSGETADVILAYEHLKKIDPQALAIAIVNRANTKLANKADYFVDTMAGIEHAVASSKVYTAQLATLLLLGLQAGWLSLPDSNTSTIQDFFSTLSDKCAQIISSGFVENDENFMFSAAKMMIDARLIVFMGRGISWPISREMALKMKELTYIPCENIAGGEFKHGPLALVDNKVVAVIIAPDHNEIILDKIASNAQEIKARKGKIIILTGKIGSKKLASIADILIVLPDAKDDYTCCFTYIVAAQIMTYHATRMMGHDVDLPRNLAKSLTVE